MEAKGYPSLLKTRKTMLFAYAFMATFIFCTGVLVVNPSVNTSFWFSHLFVNGTNASLPSSSSYSSHFTSIFSYIFSQTNPSFSANKKRESYSRPSRNETVSKSDDHRSISASGGTQSVSCERIDADDGVVSGLRTNRIGSETPNSSPPVSSIEDATASSNGTSTAKTVSTVKKDPRNSPANLVVNGNGTALTSSTATASGGEHKTAETYAKCDIFDGRWVRDDSYPLYPPGSCPYIDEHFDCYLNGRPENGYEKWRWQPKGCNIPRLDPKNMLERLRGKRLVFVGDSLNRNMWESLLCVLTHAITDKKRMFEASGQHKFRTEESYSFRFLDYNCSVEYFRSPFLVQEWETPERNGSTKETLRLDIIENHSSRYKDADILVFNTGHWWTHEKTSKGRDYYQEGNHVYGELDVQEAFKKALKTWAKWVDTNVNPKKTTVFFRGYSSSHFSGGQWNSGGQCADETEPINQMAYLSRYPSKMKVLESVLSGMRTPISYLNITRMTDYRKDAHPSIYRKRNLTEEERRASKTSQDCSHWCLPGLPETWNELLYAKLVLKWK